MDKTPIKLLVGSSMWLIPAEIVSEAFRSAVEKLNNAKSGETINLTDEEQKEFNAVSMHPNVHMGY